MTTKTRPRKSRFGLVLFLAALAAGSWFVADQFSTSGGGGEHVFSNTADTDGGPRLAFRPLPYVNYGLEPSLTRPEGQRHKQVRSSNSLGFRGREIEVPKPAGRYRVVCLGGSTTYSDLVNDDETYPVHLEQMLSEQRPDMDIEVINAGVPSYTSAESLSNLIFRCLDFEPDAIVLYQAANDLRTRAYANYESTYFHFRRIWDGSLDDPTISTLEELRGGINTFIQHDAPAGGGDPHELRRRSGTGAYERNLTSMIGVARVHGIEPVFVTFLLDKDNEFLKPDTTASIDEYNAAMKKVGAKHGATVIDLASKMPHQGMFGDYVHMNALGTKRKARVIAEGMLESVL